MKLNNAEANLLFRRLLDAFPTPGRLDIILAQPPMNTALSRIASRGGTLEDDYFQLVTAANAEGWIGQLLDGLRAVDQINPDLIALIDGFGASRAPTNVPAHLELLLDGAPFVNQHPLRHALLTMTQPHGPKVLHVTGAPTSGKTYSQYLIAHVARSVNARINLPLPFEATTTAQDVIADLADQMKLGAPPTLADGPQDSTAVTRLVRWFAIAASDLKEDWWLVFDGFDSPKIDDSLRMLMYGLAQVVGNGQPSRIRLFLLAWDRPISGPPPGRVFEQAVQSFDRPHVKDYLDELVRQFAMPSGMSSTDEILSLCYEVWDTVADPIARAMALPEGGMVNALTLIAEARTPQRRYALMALATDLLAAGAGRQAWHPAPAAGSQAAPALAPERRSGQRRGLVPVHQGRVLEGRTAPP